MTSADHVDVVVVETGCDINRLCCCCCVVGITM